MVHTMNLLFKIDKKYALQINKAVLERVDGIYINKLSESGNEEFIKVGIDLTEMLNKNEIIEDDIVSIVIKLDAYIRKYITEECVDPILTRIDYKYDLCEEDKHKREDLFLVLNKLTHKCRFLKKSGKYPLGIKYKNKCIQINIYDRNEYAKAKNRKIHEKNVIRYEIQVLNLHLNYNKYKKKIPKELNAYFKVDKRNEYLKKILKPIIFSGNYYKLREVQKILKNDSEITEENKKKLIEFLVRVSKESIDGAKAHYTKFIFDKYIKNLEVLGINPVVIPHNRKSTRIENYVAKIWGE